MKVNLSARVLKKVGGGKRRKECLVDLIHWGEGQSQWGALGKRSTADRGGGE